MGGNTVRRRSSRKGEAEGIRQGCSPSVHPTWGRSGECSEITYTVREPSACSCGSANMVSVSGDKSRWCTRSENTFPLPQDPPECQSHPTTSHSHTADTVARLSPQWPRLIHKVSHSQLSQRNFAVKTRYRNYALRDQKEKKGVIEVKIKIKIVWSSLPVPWILPNDRASSS